MSNINDKATVSLFVNGEQAEQAMERLSSKADDLRKSMQAALDSGDKKAANKLQRELSKVTKELDRTGSAAIGTSAVLAKLSNTSIHGLRNALKYLEKQLRMTKPDSTEWKKYAGQIDAVKTRIKELQSQIEGSGSIWSKFKNWAEDTWPAIDLLSRGYDSAINFMRSNVDAYASMDQEMANVRKFTGMTEDEVKSLNEEFKKIDTRTSREELNKLAQEAGRLGKTSHEDVLGFVRAADQINVALDDLGDDATLKLSKLTGIFGDEVKYGTEKSLLKVGSVINELSQNCSASAPYLAQFAERMGGVGAQARMTIPQIMGLAAVLDTNAQAVEASSTAVSQVLVRMMRDPAKYAKVAGLEVNKFATMLKEDANGALIMFLEALQKAGGMDVLSPMFKDMGENGSRAISALSTLATHIDQVKAQQEAANIAFEEGTSISKEFAVQNNTVQAALDKAKERFQELRRELGERLYPLMRHIITSGSAFVNALLVMINYISNNKREVLNLVIAISAYTIAVNAAAVKTKIATAAKKAWTTAVSLAKVAVNIFTLNLKGAKTAAESLNVALKKNIFGLIAAAIAYAIVKLQEFCFRTDEVVKKYSKAVEINEEAGNRLKESIKSIEAETKSEINALEALYKVATDETRSREERTAAANKLLKLYPDYFKEFNAELIMVGKAKIAYDDLKTAILNASKARVNQAKLDENNETISDHEAEIDILINEGQDAVNNYHASTNLLKSYEADLDSQRKKAKGRAKSTLEVDSPSLTNAENRVKRQREIVALWNKKIKETEAKIQSHRDAIKQLNDDNDRLASQSVSLENSTSSITNTPLEPDGGCGDNNIVSDRFAKEKAWRERQEAEARISYARGETTYSEHTARMSSIAADYYERLLAREDVFGDERLQIEADYEESISKERTAFNKVRLDEEDRNYQDLLDRLRSNHQDRINQESLTAQERQREQEYYAEVLELAELQHLQNILDIYEEGSDEWLEAQRRLQEKEIAAQERHLKKMERQQQMYADIKKKVFGMNQDEKDAEFARQFAALTDVYNQELAMVGDNEAEKLRIKEAYMAAELALRKEYNQEGAEDSRSSYETAIGKSVEWLQGDGGKALTGTISTLTSGMSSIFSGLSSMIQAELEIQTAKIEKRYGREIQLAQGNSYMVAQLEKKKAAELAKEKNKANKKMFAMQVIQAVAQTAQNAISAYGSAAAIPVVGHVLAPIAAAMAVAAGAIQIAAIKKQQQASEAQGYSKGGFTKPGAVDEPAGIVHAGEWVASQKLLANPIARPMIEALDLAQRTNTIGSLKPEDVSRSITANNSLARIAESDSGSALMVAAAMKMAKTADSLTDRLNEPFVTINTVTGPHGINQAQDDYERLMKNVTPKSKFK